MTPMAVINEKREPKVDPTTIGTKRIINKTMGIWEARLKRTALSQCVTRPSNECAKMTPRMAIPLPKSSPIYRFPIVTITGNETHDSSIITAVILKKQGNDDAASLPFVRPPASGVPSRFVSLPVASPPIPLPTSRHPSFSAGPASSTKGARCVGDGDQAMGYKKTNMYAKKG